MIRILSIMIILNSTFWSCQAFLVLQGLDTLKIKSETLTNTVTPVKKKTKQQAFNLNMNNSKLVKEFQELVPLFVFRRAPISILLCSSCVSNMQFCDKCTFRWLELKNSHKSFPTSIRTCCKWQDEFISQAAFHSSHFNLQCCVFQNWAWIYHQSVEAVMVDTLLGFSGFCIFFFFFCLCLRTSNQNPPELWSWDLNPRLQVS